MRIEVEKVRIEVEKVRIEIEKVRIEVENVRIEVEKVRIEIEKRTRKVGIEKIAKYTGTLDWHTFGPQRNEGSKKRPNSKANTSHVSWCCAQTGTLWHILNAELLSKG